MVERLSNFVPDWLAKRAALSPQKVAIVDVGTGQEFTYAQWNAQANRTAHFFRQLGVSQGDRVAILTPNCVAYLDTFFACNKTGSILQALNWRLTASELHGLIADARPTVLIYAAEFAETVQTLQAGLSPSEVGHWLALDQPLRPQDVPFSQRETQPATPPPPVERQATDPWVICYTGGTTGLPKGALLTYGSIQANAVNTIVSWGLTADDVAILNTPLFHTGGLNVFTAPLVQVGGTTLLCQGFDVNQTLELIDRAGVTLYFGVPTMFAMMQQHPDWAQTDFSKLKLIISGGAPCPQEIFEQFWARGIDFKSGYGLTEAGPNNFWLPPADVRRKPGSVGVPLFHVDVRVVNDAGEECGPHQVGELLVRGDHVCGGYWNNPEATAEAIVDGWLHTGDLASYDEEGYFTIVGRLKEMFISGGENIYPAEIENVIFSHPGVSEVAVIGLPHPKWGEVGCAIVVRSDPALEVTDLQAYCRERLAGYKVPKSIVFLPELPKTGAGKIDKQSLRQELQSNP